MDTHLITLFSQTCTKCLLVQSQDQFVVKRTGRLALQCETCRKAKRHKDFIAWRIRNPKLPPREPIISPNGRLCRTCGERKQKEDFWKDKRSRDGLAWRCKSCACLAHRKWTDANREHVRDVARESMRRNRQNEPSRQRETLRRSRLWTKYGLTPEELELRLKDQEGVCKICSKVLTLQKPDGLSKGAVACVDHDHMTGNIRGILCSPCNRAIGLLQDSPEILRTAALYLEGS